MTAVFTRALKVATFVAALSVAPLAASAEMHRVAFQVNDNDPQRMNLVLNNVNNLISAYAEMGDEVEVQIVAYGPGLNMLRADTSPVAARIAAMSLEHQNVSFQACNNTIQGIQRRTGEEVTLLPEATIVPAGVVHLVHLQEQGWSYIRP
ncbi:MAG: DsrE family protein [Pararhodobacter sp.]